MGFVRETSTAMTSRTKDNNSSLKSYLNTFDIKGTYSKRVDIDVRQLMKTHKRLHQVSKSQTNRPCITDRS